MPPVLGSQETQVISFSARLARTSNLEMRRLNWRTSPDPREIQFLLLDSKWVCMQVCAHTYSGQKQADYI